MRLFLTLSRPLFRQDDLGGGGGGEDEDDDGGSQDPPGGGKLLAGKYKTVEEMEDAYKEAERKLSEMGSTNSSLRSQVEQLQSAGSRERQPQKDANPDLESLNEKFFENPTAVQGQITQQMLSQMRTTEKKARRNVKLIVAELSEDPLFEEVRTQFEAELEMVDDSVLADENAARKITEMVFNTVIGTQARRLYKEAKTDPKARQQVVKRFSPAEPTSDDDRGSADVDPRDVSKISSALGLDKSASDRMRKRYLDSQEDE